MTSSLSSSSSSRLDSYDNDDVGSDVEDEAYFSETSKVRERQSSCVISINKQQHLKAEASSYC